VSFTRDQSFVMKWVFDDSQQFQNDLLNHEQGHYNISALLARDCFVDVMLLKLLTFRTVEDGTAKVHQIKQGSLHKARAINDLYDKEIHPEQRSGNSRGPIQQSWDSFIQSAFTKARSTGTQSVDGIPHRVRLVDVLIQNGKRI
jgi:hypothetical protein